MKAFRTRFAPLASVALGAALAAAGPAPAQTHTMKMASATINDVQHEWLRRFDAEIKPKVGDRLKVEIYPASQLGAIPRMVEGVTLGSIESFVTPPSFLVTLEPRYQIFDAIGVFRSPDHLCKVLADPGFRKRALALGEAKGLQGIGIFYNSPVIVLSKKPIRTLGDFQGQKIRVFATPLQIEPMKALGAIPVPMALNEVLPALQSGTIDGMLAGIPVLTAMKFYDAAKAITEIHPGIVVSTVVVNRRWLDGLPAELRTAITAAGDAVDKGSCQVAAGIVARANKGWVDNGGQLLQLPPADQAKMMADLKALGSRLLSQNPAVKAEYDELLKVADRVR
jgi:TRAP-type C4-dicarboxylate transport system substrate-binding protein